MGVRKAAGDVYRQITLIPKTDKKITGKMSSKHCVSPTTEQMLSFYPLLTDCLYANPFWKDLRVISDDKTARKIWQYAEAIPKPSRGVNLAYFSFILALHVASSFYLTLNFPTAAAVVIIGFFITYDLIWFYFLCRRAQINRYLRLMLQSGLQTLNRHSRNEYQKWLNSLHDSDFSKFAEIQRWHQQELQLEESRKQTDALNRAASLAAITAYNTSVIRNNQPNPHKAF